MINKLMMITIRNYTMFARSVVFSQLINVMKIYELGMSQLKRRQGREDQNNVKKLVKEDSNTIDFEIDKEKNRHVLNDRTR